MAVYRIEFLDHGQNVRATAEIECADNAQAIKEAHEAHVPSIGFGFDVWQGDRLVYQHKRR